MSGRNSHKSKARQWRRAAFRQAVTQIQADTGVRRETAVRMLATTGAHWSDFGLPYTGFGEAILGPPLPEGLARKSSFAKDGVPFGIRQGVSQREKEAG